MYRILVVGYENGRKEYSLVSHPLDDPTGLLCKLFGKLCTQKFTVRYVASIFGSRTENVAIVVRKFFSHKPRIVNEPQQDCHFSRK